MSEYFRTNPSKIYEYASGVSKVASVALAPAVGANQTLIAAITSTIIRVHGISFQSQTATQAGIVILNGSGGTILYRLIAPASTLPPFLLPICDCGYFETTSGVGLFGSVTTGDAYINVFYTTYSA